MPCWSCGEKHVMVAVFVDGSQRAVCSDDGHAEPLDAESGFVGWSLCTPDCAEFGCDGYLGSTTPTGRIRTWWTRGRPSDPA